MPTPTQKPVGNRPRAKYPPSGQGHDNTRTYPEPETLPENQDVTNFKAQLLENQGAGFQKNETPNEETKISLKSKTQPRNEKTPAK